jgi:hypothetical protein
VGGQRLCAVVAQNNAAKTALSAAAKNAAEWSVAKWSTFFGYCIRREPSASGARVADTDSRNVVEAVDAYGLPQDWRDFLP